MSFKVTTSLPTLLRTKPANFNGYLTKFDAVARHPSVWPFFLGSIFGAAFVTYPSVAVGEKGFKESPYIHRAIQMEEYKAKKGHYPH